MKKLCNVLSWIYGYGMLVTFIAGGLTFFGYVIALCIGGEVATQICEIISRHVFKAIIIAASCFVVLGLLKLYLSGEIQAGVRKKRAEAKQKREQKKEKRAQRRANVTERQQAEATDAPQQQDPLRADGDEPTAREQKDQSGEEKA